MKNNSVINFFDLTSTGLGVFGLQVSINDLSNVLNLILLIISIANILLVCGLRIFNALKSKNLNELVDTLEDTKKQVEEIKNEVDRHNKD